VDAADRSPTAFFLYRDSPLRREALRLGPGAGERYSLYGLDEVVGAGFQAGHNLAEGLKAGPSARALGRVLDQAVLALGGYSGDFGSVLACRRSLRAADVVFSTVDTVGIPLALLGRAGVVRTPVVYAAIGLPERLERLGTGTARRLFESAYQRLHTIVAYGWGEVDELRSWLGDGGPRIEFVPFGVDPEYFRPQPFRTPDADVVSVGADPRRDFPLLVELARRLPERSFSVVVSSEHARALGGTPANVSIEVDVAFPVVRDRLAAGRIVVLPVLENSYSGATTTLLQAMATGKPVVVTRTAAIARGYHLEDGFNCRLVPPGDLSALEGAVTELGADEERAEVLGRRARETVERHLTWRRYTDSIRDLLLAACTPSSFPS
jgi:glycosyltransferase involved in cell wall biosynthesis